MLIRLKYDHSQRSYDSTPVQYFDVFVFFINNIIIITIVIIIIIILLLFEWNLSVVFNGPAIFFKY